jgi:hypothetical protein
MARAHLFCRIPKAASPCTLSPGNRKAIPSTTQAHTDHKRHSTDPSPGQPGAPATHFFPPTSDAEKSTFPHCQSPTTNPSKTRDLETAPSCTDRPNSSASPSRICNPLPHPRLPAEPTPASIGHRRLFLPGPSSESKVRLLSRASCAHSRLPTPHTHNKERERKWLCPAGDSSVALPFPLRAPGNPWSLNPDQEPSRRAQ